MTNPPPRQRQQQRQLEPAPPPIPNARYFPLSPTYTKWVKLSAADIHALRQVPGFEGQNIFFHLNHPIRYLYLVAPVVAISEPSGGNLVLLTLDDSSGCCIDVKLSLCSPSTTTGTPTTAVANVDYTTAVGADPDLRVDGVKVDVGTVLKVKCTLGVFRGTKQLELKRCSVIRDTTEEIMAWEAMAAFKRDVLSRPWELSEAEQKAWDEREKEEEEKKRREQRALRKKEESREKKKKAKEEQREKRRLAAEEKFNRGALV